VTPALRLLGVVALLLGLQQLLVSALPEAARPDLLLVLALGLGLRARPISSLLLAFGLGLAVDVLSAAPGGTYALLRGTACAATRLADQILYLRAAMPWATYVAAYQGVDLLLLGLLELLLFPEASVDWAVLLARAPGAILTTGLAALPLAAWFQRWGITSSADGTRGALAVGRSRS
jgi:cell shape-determining protein MreD